MTWMRTWMLGFGSHMALLMEMGPHVQCAGQGLWTMSAMSAVGCPGGGKDADLSRDGVEPRWEE